MLFRGQPAIMNQLSIYLPYLDRERDAGMAFMVTGPSGMGKTRLCFQCCNYLEPKGRYQYELPGNGTIKLNTSVRVNFIDEIHLLKEPEILYPYLDRNDRIIFLATNDSGELPEALINRCTPLIFAPYSNEDLIGIARGIYTYQVDETFMEKIVRAGFNNPRQIVYLSSRLVMYTKLYGIPTDLDSVLYNTFGVKDGVDTTGQRYLDFLRHVGGKASLDTLSAGLHISKTMILFQVEPPLLYQGKIQISSKGRILC